MGLSELLERLGRNVFEAPFSAASQMSDSPEVAEIRVAILEKIRNRSQRAGGHDIFPYNVIRIHIRGAGNRDSAIFERDFLRKFFEQEIRTSLGRRNCRFPEDLRVEVRLTGTDPESANDWVWIEVDSSEPAAEAAEARPRRTAKLTVIAGKANKPELTLQKIRTNIGRAGDVYKSEGLSRRNDLVFAEDTAINRTVSREHAHILHDKKNDEYRLFNDRWYKRGNKTQENCGIWIVRDGMGHEVHRDSRGTKLHSGDEIHLGKAILKFQMK